MKNRQKYINKAKKFKEIQVKKLSVFKKELKCKLCSENEPACLDFHHLDPNVEEYSISNLIRSHSFERTLKEIKKCIVLCSNCHRKLHADIIQLVE